MLSPRQSLFAGARAILPILVGVVPFGLIYGVVAVASGIDQLPAILMSVIVFAGASQIAAAELWGNGAPLLIVVATGLVINVRFAMYSASLAAHLNDVSRLRRLGLAYLLTDQAYAVSVVHFEQGAAESPEVQKASYYLGAGLGLWITWQASALVGVLIGLRVPASWGLEFSVPLMFLALTVSTLRDRHTVIVAAVSAIAAVLFHRLPLHSGLMVAALTALALGALLELRKR